MELHYSISENDYIQFNIFHYENSKTTKRLRLFLGILVPLLFVLLGFIMVKRLDFFPFLLAVIFALVWFGSGGKTYKKILSFNIKKLMQEGKSNEFIGERTLSLLEEKILTVETYHTTESSYDSIQRIESDSERLYIYTGAISAFIIPFSAFDSETQKQEFLNILKQKAKL